MITLLGSRLVGDHGQVIAFEPNPSPSRILQDNLSRNGIFNVELREAGLGDSPADMPLFVPSINTGEGSFTAPGADCDGAYIRCPILVGDDVIGDRRPRLVKIDVEGFEVRVLAGMEETIRTAKPVIVVEMVDRHLHRDSQTPAKLIAWLEARGYRGQRLGLTRKKQLECSPIPEEWRDGDYVFAHPDNPI